jgi:hypothetical protein
MGTTKIHLLPGLLLATLGLGCMHEVTTEVRLRDPSQAAIRRENAVQDLLPEGRAPASASVAAGTIPMGPTSTAAYEIRAAREESGAIVLEVSTKLPLTNGERHVIVGAGGEILGPEDLLSPADLERPALTVPACARLFPVKAGMSTEVGRCTPASLARAHLLTPWANVVEIRRKSVPRRTGAAVLAGVLGGVLGLPGVPVLAAGLSSKEPVLTEVGGAFVGVAALVFVVLAPTIFGSDRIEILFPRKAQP